MTHFQRLQRLFPLAIALHNLEEGLWLPGWAAAHAAYLPWHPKPLKFRAILLVLTLAAFFVTDLSLKKGLGSSWTRLFLAYSAIMLLNVFVPHLPATIYFHAYTPGVVTACCAILPLTGALVFLGVRDGALPGWRARATTLGVPVALAIVAAVFFLRRLPR
ncbi:MAG: HXXEE domain-containing protein [Bryobacteraceae bacterium]